MSGREGRGGHDPRGRGMGPGRGGPRSDARDRRNLDPATPATSKKVARSTSQERSASKDNNPSKECHSSKERHSSKEHSSRHVRGGGLAGPDRAAQADEKRAREKRFNEEFRAKHSKLYQAGYSDQEVRRMVVSRS